MRKTVLTVLLSVLSIPCLQAHNGTCKWPDEHPGKLTVGLRVGAAHSRIGSLTSVLESGEKKPTYTWEKGFYVMPTLSLFGQYQIDRTGFEVEASYYSQGERLKYGNTVPKPVEAEYMFVNHYLGAGLNIKLYLTKGLYMGVGGRYGFHIGEQDIRFKYSGTSAKRLDVTKNLKEEITATNEIGAGVILGWEHESGFHTELRFIHGLTDMLNVKKENATDKTFNTSGYTDCVCQTNWLSLTVGFSVTIFDNIKKLDKCKKHKMRPFWRLP